MNPLDRSTTSQRGARVPVHLSRTLLAPTPPQSDKQHERVHEEERRDQHHEADDQRQRRLRPSPGRVVGLLGPAPDMPPHLTSGIGAVPLECYLSAARAAAT